MPLLNISFVSIQENRQLQDRFPAAPSVRTAPTGRVRGGHGSRRRRVRVRAAGMSGKRQSELTGDQPGNEDPDENQDEDQDENQATNERIRNLSPAIGIRCDWSTTSGSGSGERGRRHRCAPRHRPRAAARALVQGRTGQDERVPLAPAVGRMRERRCVPSCNIVMNSAASSATAPASPSTSSTRPRLQGMRHRPSAAGTRRDVSTVTSPARPPGERPTVGEGMIAFGNRMRSSGTRRSTSVPAHAKAFRHTPVSHLAPT